MASTIPDFLTRYLPRMEFIDIHYVYGGCGGSRSLNPARATDFPTTLCFHSQYKLLQSGICLYHILFKLRQLVYTLYTFTIATLANVHVIPTTIIWVSAKQMEIAIDLARRCLGLSPNQPASTLVVSNKALSFTVYQEESLSCIPIPTRIHFSLSVYIIHQNFQKVKISMCLCGKTPNPQMPSSWGF